MKDEEGEGGEVEKGDDMLRTMMSYRGIDWVWLDGRLVSAAQASSAMMSVDSNEVSSNWASTFSLSISRNPRGEAFQPRNEERGRGGGRQEYLSRANDKDRDGARSRDSR